MLPKRTPRPRCRATVPSIMPSWVPATPAWRSRAGSVNSIRRQALPCSRHHPSEKDLRPAIPAFTGSEVLPRTATLAGARKRGRQTALMRKPSTWLKGMIAGAGIECELQKVRIDPRCGDGSREASLRQVVRSRESQRNKPHVVGRNEIAERIGSDYYRFGLYLERHLFAATGSPHSRPGRLPAGRHRIFTKIRRSND